MVVSILSLVYNHENYLEAFFEGVLSQELINDFEIVIGIDKSNDASLEICKKYQGLYPGIIKIIEHKERVGMIRNFNATYNACQGKYIAICEGDDYWIDKQKLIKQIKVLEDDKNAVISFTDIKMFDNEAQTFHPNWATIKKEKYTIKDIIESNTIATCSVMFRNDCVAINEDSFKGLSMADWPLYIQLLVHGYAMFLNCTTAIYRISFQSSYSKNSVVEQLLKKKETYEYLLKMPVLANFKKYLFKAYTKNLYAIAIRLDKNDKRRTLFLRNAIKGMYWNNIVIPIKAFVRIII